MKISLITSFIPFGMAVAWILLPIQSLAQTPAKVTFYCGQTLDPTSNAIVPTTLVASSSRREPVALIQWKSKLSGKYTPQVRCNIVSTKFQQAWEAKRLNYLTAGVDKKSGLGIICGTKDSSTPCDRVSMLFALSNGADASETIYRMKEIAPRTDGPLVIACFGDDNIINIRSIIN